MVNSQVGVSLSQDSATVASSWQEDRKASTNESMEVMCSHS